MGEKTKSWRTKWRKPTKKFVWLRLSLWNLIYYLFQNQTRGIDVGAKQLVLETLKEYNRERKYNYSCNFFRNRRIKKHL